MKKFRFKLQAVLEYRSDQLDLVQQKVAEEEKKRFDILARIHEYDAMIEQALAEQTEFLRQPHLDPARAASFPAYLFRLKQYRFFEYEALKEQEKRLSEVRKELQEALIKKKSLEKLKEKEQARYDKRLAKAEEEFLSELALRRAYYQKHNAS